MNLPTKISFSGEDERNCLLFDAGLHTLSLRKGKNESDNEFVTRFLIQFLEGCKERDPDAKGFFICLQDGANYLSVGKICSEEEVKAAKDKELDDRIEKIVFEVFDRIGNSDSHC